MVGLAPFKWGRIVPGGGGEVVSAKHVVGMLKYYPSCRNATTYKHHSLTALATPGASAYNGQMCRKLGALVNSQAHASARDPKSETVNFQVPPHFRHVYFFVNA